jgi:hypothetical protein
MSVHNNSLGLTAFGTMVVDRISGLPYLAMDMARQKHGSIFETIPRTLLRTDGKWELVENQINNKLKKFIGRPAEMLISVDYGGPTPGDQFGWIPRIAANSPIDAITGLPVLLYAYFECADAEQIARIRACGKHDRLTVRGKILRADLYRQPQGWRLNVDLHGCTTVD